jgi:formylglycine-generating enzyme required for sulfatase activity
MADFTLTPFERSYLIQIMNTRGGWDTDTARRNFFSDTYSDSLANLQFQVAISGSTDEFSKSLVRELEKQGALPNRRRHALNPLLRHLRVLASGWQQEVTFIEELLDKLDKWADQRPATSLPTTLSSTEQRNLYNEVVRYFGQSQWQKVLQRVAQLEAHGFTQDRIIPLAEMKQRATEALAKAQRLTDMQEDYEQIVALTQLPDMQAIAKQAWSNFGETYQAEFAPHHDTHHLNRYFESLYYLEMMRDMTVPAVERAEAGRRLAEIGDPRPAVMDGDRMEFCYVPAGRFWMGSDENDEMSYDDERPAGWYDIPYAYWIGRYPITNAQFGVFVKDGGYQNERWWGLAKSAGYWSKAGFKGGNDDKPRMQPHDYGAPFNLSNHPVVGVSWFEAIAYIEWLKVRWQSKLPKGWTIVLPNEPEWEKAARGGEKIPEIPMVSVPNNGLNVPLGKVNLVANQNPRRRYTWGDEPIPALANYDATGINTTGAVGCFADGASPYGCEELNGNIWEWSRSEWINKYPYEADKRENLTLHNKPRVLRGGTFNVDERYVRCAFRGWDSPYGQYGGDGFRVAVVVVSPFTSGL